jgi:uncharacterized protein YabN with tetrapyrrole methylase and pyrophosphatase domain
MATTARAPTRPSLTIVGIGIAVGQITVEALGHIQRADRVVALTENPLSLAWLKKRRPGTESLRPFYATKKSRAETYDNIVNRVMSLLRQGHEVCLALYGHPGVFATPAHELIRRAREEQFPARMLPGVSAEDCLFADLGVDPGKNGCQSFDATDFLLHKRIFDPCSALVLWQIGVVGERASPAKPKMKNVALLVRVLARTYGGSHKVIVYEAAAYPPCEPTRQVVNLDGLAKTAIAPMSTLFVPPLQGRAVDKRMLRRLGLAS